MKIKIWYTDFWNDLNPETFFLTNMFRKTGYEVEINKDNPDFLFYSCFGSNHWNFNSSKKIFYTGENIRSNFDQCDWALTFDFINNERHLRLPLYVMYYDDESVKPLFNKEYDTNRRNKFCAFIHSNSNATKRNNFFNLLNEYKKVDSGGRAFNNIGYLVSDKIEWLKDYKFCLCFENASHHGYTTEKLVQGMMGGCIPIYWGSTSANLEFNNKSFINWHDYNDDKLVIDKIIELDNDQNKYMNYYNEPYLIDNKPNKWMDEDRVIEFLKKIVTESYIRP